MAEIPAINPADLGLDAEKLKASRDATRDRLAKPEAPLGAAAENVETNPQQRPADKAPMKAIDARAALNNVAAQKQIDNRNKALEEARQAARDAEVPDSARNPAASMGTIDVRAAIEGGETDSQAA